MWLRLACTVTRYPFGCPRGTLTLRNVRGGSGRREHRLGEHRGRARRRPEVPVAASSALSATPRSPDDPSSAASSAPATVPEYVTSSPRFQPLLMPETTRSGQPLEHLRDRDVDAVGRRAVHGEDAIVDRLEAQRPAQRQRVADGARLSAGATIVTSPSGRSASASAWMPRKIAVVVGDENARHAERVRCVSSRRTHRSPQTLQRGGVAVLGTALFTSYKPRVAEAASAVMPPPNGVDDSAALQAALSNNGEVQFDAIPACPSSPTSWSRRGGRSPACPGPGNTIFKFKGFRADQPRRQMRHPPQRQLADHEATDISIEIEFDGNI